LIFVVPEDIFNGFRWQTYQTTGGRKFNGWNNSNQWIRSDIDQYVLKMTLLAPSKRQNDEETDVDKRIKT
jgi:hypothetical protein